MLEADLRLIENAAQDAGHVARGYFGAAPETWQKPGGAGPVTQADLAVDALLRAQLGAARPDYGWLSEESEDAATRLDHDAVFIVDPIDGTRAFIEGSKDWSHSIAVARQGRVVAAAVYLPLRDLMYSATLGGGAYVNGTPLNASACAAPNEAKVLCTKHNMAPEFWQSPPQFKRSLRSGLAYRLCLVAEGRFDAMLTLRPTWEWDVAAGALIVTEAGGQVMDRHGTAPQFNAPNPQIDGLLAGGPVTPALRAALA